MRSVRFSNEMALVIVLVTIAIIFSLVDFVKNNPIETLAIIGGIILWKNRHKVKSSSDVTERR